MLKNKNVLIIDDDESVQQILLHTIKLLNCQKVINVSSVDQALFYLDQDNFDLIFLDLMMPERNGSEVLDYLNNKNIWCSVLVYTASNEKEKKKILTNYLMVQNLSISVLSKPCPEIRIIEAISEIMERHHCSELKYKIMPELHKKFNETNDELKNTKNELEEMKKSLVGTIKDVITDDLPKLVAESIKKNQKALFTFILTLLSTAFAYYSGLLHDFIKK